MFCGNTEENNYTGTLQVSAPPRPAVNPDRRQARRGAGSWRSPRPAPVPVSFWRRRLRWRRVRAEGSAAPARIDVHHHFLPPFHVDAMMMPGRRMGPAPPQWSPALSLEEMDRSGISTAIFCPSSSPASGLESNVEEARSLARRLNEYAVGLVKDYPGGFGLFACIAPPDADGSLKEYSFRSRSPYVCISQPAPIPRCCSSSSPDARPRAGRAPRSVSRSGSIRPRSERCPTRPRRGWRTRGSGRSCWSVNSAPPSP